MTHTATDPETIATRYIESWKEHDWDGLRAILADDVTFNGPLASLEGADDCVDGLRRMSEIVTDIAVRKRWVAGGDVLTWFELHTTVADPAATANWSRISDGKITAIDVTFDARPLAPPS